MATINRDGIEFDVYADQTAAENYALGSMDATTWSAASDDTKERTLITATRILDRQEWADDYNTFELRLADENVVAAAIELAFGLAAGSDVETNANQQTKEITSMKAGSVSIEFGGSGSVAAFGPPSRWPLPIQEKLRGKLASSAGSTLGSGGISSGTDGCSVNENNFGLTRGY